MVNAPQVAADDVRAILNDPNPARMNAINQELGQAFQELKDSPLWKTIKKIENDIVEEELNYLKNELRRGQISRQTYEREASKLLEQQSQKFRAESQKDVAKRLQ